MSISQSFETIIGHFPPSSRIQGVRFFAAASATSFPFYVDPVKTIESKGSLHRLTARNMPPSITL